MLALFLGHVVLFSAFPIYFTTLEPLLRRAYFYLYLGLILLIGGILGNAYALNLADGLTVSGGNLCYGAFMMTSVLFALVERDIFVLRRVIRLVIVVDLFNISLSLLATAALTDAAVTNPHGTPSALFRQSVPLIFLGGVLIVTELFVLFYWFEQVKKRRLSTAVTGAAYLAGFVAVLCADGLLFPFIAFGVSPPIVDIVFGGLSGKALTALAYSAPLLLFMTLWHRRFARYLEADVFTWRTFLATSSDLIRELSENERALRQADAVFRTSDNGLAILDGDGRLVRANGAFLQLTGAPETPTGEWFTHAGRALPMPPDPHAPWRGEVSFGPGGTAQGLLSVTPVSDSDELTLICSLADITEQKRVQAELDHLAMHDALTDLPNRRALDAALAQVTGPLALVIADLDRFKDVNDSFGHVAGDELLCRVGARLRAALPADGLQRIYRIGGDEFALLLPGADEAGLRDTVARLSELLLRPIALTNGREVALTATWGASLAASPAEADLYAKADAALYDVKHGTRGGLGIYREDLTRAAQRRLALSLRLRRAIDDGTISVVYQPQIDRTGRVSGLEGLARWTDDEFGPVPPEEFIALAEDHGLTGTLCTYVLRQACRDGAEWLAAGVPFGHVAVNVSGTQVRAPGLRDQVAEALDSAAFPANRLELELTETAFLGRESEVAPVFSALKGLGLRLAIDDFGTGYSALSYLPALPWDTLKIDRSFVSRAARDPRRKSLIAAIASLASGLDLWVVAEGVESAEQHRLLMDIGCDAFQGFMFSRPIPADQVAAFCARHRDAALSDSQG